MTVAEAVKQSKSRGLFNGKLIAYAQSQLADDEDLICAAVVMVTRTHLMADKKKMNYLNRMENTSRVKALLCATTKRIAFFSYALGSGISYSLPLCENPKLDASESKSGIGVGGLRLVTREAIYFISANRKLINFLKSGIMAAFMIYQDRFVPKPEAAEEPADLPAPDDGADAPEEA